jgi:hypothetical protein
MKGGFSMRCGIRVGHIVIGAGILIVFFVLMPVRFLWFLLGAMLVLGGMLMLR